MDGSPAALKGTAREVSGKQVCPAGPAREPDRSDRHCPASSLLLFQARNQTILNRFGTVKPRTPISKYSEALDRARSPCSPLRSNRRRGFTYGQSVPNISGAVEPAAAIAVPTQMLVERPRP
jgi:hypothetical protein